MAMIRCFLSVAGLPKALWPKAVQAAVNIQSSPHELSCKDVLPLRFGWAEFPNFTSFKFWEQQLFFTWKHTSQSCSRGVEKDNLSVKVSTVGHTWCGDQEQHKPLCLRM
ncbi:unnamed protein product [Discosporangium mesarthrocarpum]